MLLATYSDGFHALPYPTQSGVAVVWSYEFKGRGQSERFSLITMRGRSCIPAVQPEFLICVARDFKLQFKVRLCGATPSPFFIACAESLQNRCNLVSNSLKLRFFIFFLKKKEQINAMTSTLG